jgi:hypothetical protein
MSYNLSVSFRFVTWSVSEKKALEKIKTYFMINNVFFIKSCLLRDNYKKNIVRALQATDGNLQNEYCTLRLQINNHDMQYLLVFNRNNSCTSAPKCYVTRTMPVLFYQTLSFSVVMYQNKHFS